MHVFSSVNCCLYLGKCGNGLQNSTKVLLGRNLRTCELGIVAGEDIDAGEVLGQYLREIEHVSTSRVKRPRNRGYCLVLKQKPERPAHGVCAAINAERMGSLMRFVNHSCRPAAVFVELSNGGRTTVVVVSTRTIRRGEEVTVVTRGNLGFSRGRTVAQFIPSIQWKRVDQTESLGMRASRGT
jgi:hypothetical protein